LQGTETKTHNSEAEISIIQYYQKIPPLMKMIKPNGVSLIPAGCECVLIRITSLLPNKLN
jgi:hypothetical protein